jgi:general secretion pathway protein D
MKLGTDVKVVPETGTLIITDYAYRMERIEELLSMLDKPGKEKTFSFRTLKYTMAGVIAPQVQKLAGQLGTMSVTVAAPAPAAKPTTRRRRQPAKKPAPTPAKTTPSEVYLEADERTNRILMIGFEEQLLVINELIDALDVEQRDLRTMRLYEIQYVDASEVVDKLSALEIISASQASARSPGRSAATAGGKSKSKTPAAPRPVTTTAGGVEKAGPAEEPQLVIIESTNSLLVNATAIQHIQIATIIGYLDRELEKALIPYVVYPLENQDPEKLIGILLQLIQETVVEEAGKDAKIQKKTTTKKIEEDITVVADPETYSLIVYASKKNQQWIASLIKQLDAYRPQVLLDVTLVQITKDDAFNLDLKLIANFPHPVDTSAFGGMGRFFELQSDPKDEIGTAFYGDEHITALLKMMQTKKYGRIMARPKLLVNDNQEGQIKTTTTTYIRRERKDIIGTESPKEVVTESFDDYSAGITLTIKPHISMGDMLRLEITLNRSGFTEPLEEITKPPNKADADVKTVVTIPDRSTIILGGMEKIEHGKGGKKIPILGDLPLIGGAFRDVSKVGAQDKLYIFVKAHILRPGGDLGLADLKDVSGKNRETFEKLEQEMQEYEAWPGIKPEPMDPLRILEEDVR